MSENITLSPQRMIGDIVMDVTIEETGTDDLTITQHPIETGAAITDHAYKNAVKLSIRAAASNSSEAAGGDDNYVSDLYHQLFELQASRVPFAIITGKRPYENMLFASLGVTTEEGTEAALMISASFQEAIIVSTQTTTFAPPANQAAPAKTGAPNAQGVVAPAAATPPAAAGGAGGWAGGWGG